MRCKTCSKQLMALVQGELAAKARAEVEAHLASCARCADELARLRATLRLLDARSDLEPSAGFDAGFARALAAAERQEPARAGRGASWWRLPALATAAAAACAVIVAVAVTRVAPPPAATGQRPTGDLELVQDLELLQNFDVVDNLDGLQDYDVVMNIDDLLAQQRSSP